MISMTNASVARRPSAPLPASAVAAEVSVVADVFAVAAAAVARPQAAVVAHQGWDTAGVAAVARPKHSLLGAPPRDARPV